MSARPLIEALCDKETLHRPHLYRWYFEFRDHLVRCPGLKDQPQLFSNTARSDAQP